jgi:predicted nuclease of predicted toxin-antitoxin system
MKILVDENIPKMTAEALIGQGLEVVDIRGTDEQGIRDEELWRKAQDNRALLITTDKGFASHRDERHYGILIVRLKQPTRLKIHQRVMQAIQKFSEKEWHGLMVVMRDSVQTRWKFRE